VTDYLAFCARLPERELIAAECENLTGGKPEADGVAMCRSVELIPNGAYVHTGMRLIAHSATLEDLLQEVAKLTFPAEDFRIEHMRLAGHKLVNSREAAIRLANVIRDYPNLEAPKHRFLLVERESGLWFGEILAESAYSYRQHDHKPYRTSSSLPSRLARLLVNLVSPPAQMILDPCCGTGSILLEAQALGLKTCGVDWNPGMVEMTQNNLAYYGYSGEIILADTREVNLRAEAIVTDLPYGLFMHENPLIIQDILRHVRCLAPVAVFVAGKDIRDWLQEAGYCDVEVFRIRKHKDFSRYVHRVRSGTVL
jgi:tRNA G10  N-methylase Trm11